MQEKWVIQGSFKTTACPSASRFPAVESKVRDVKEQPPSVSRCQKLAPRNILRCMGRPREPWTLHVNSMGRRNRTLNDPNPRPPPRTCICPTESRSEEGRQEVIRNDEARKNERCCLTGCRQGGGIGAVLWCVAMLWPAALQLHSERWPRFSSTGFYPKCSATKRKHAK